MIRLLELRQEKEWSQREVARRLFISQGTYNNWENGKTQPSIEQLIALSKLFEVSIDYLVGNTAEYEGYTPTRKTADYKKIMEKLQDDLTELKNLLQ